MNQTSPSYPIKQRPEIKSKNKPIKRQSLAIYSHPVHIAEKSYFTGILSADGEKFNIISPSLVIRAKGFYLGCLLAVNRIAELSKREKAPFPRRPSLPPTCCRRDRLPPIRLCAFPNTLPLLQESQPTLKNLF